MALESPLFIWYLHHLCRLFSHMNACFWGSSHCHVWLLEGNSFRNIAGWQIEVLQDVVRIEIQPQSRSSPKQQRKLMETLATDMLNASALFPYWTRNTYEGLGERPATKKHQETDHLHKFLTLQHPIIVDVHPLLGSSQLPLGSAQQMMDFDKKTCASHAKAGVRNVLQD